MKAKREDRRGPKDGKEDRRKRAPLSCRTSGHQVARIGAHYVRGLIVMQKLTVANGVIGVSVFNGFRVRFGLFVSSSARGREDVCGISYQRD